MAAKNAKSWEQLQGEKGEILKGINSEFSRANLIITMFIISLVVITLLIFC